VEFEFITVDVFTDDQFGGNPVAVVLDTDALTTEQMQLIAREFNLSETTFVGKPADPGNSAHVRIFTPAAEMPFAGHPNVGTAWALAKHGHLIDVKPKAGEFRFEEIAGLVPVVLLGDDSTQPTGARLTSPALFTINDSVSVSLVARACSLPENAIHTDAHEPLNASCGTPFHVARVNTRADLAAATPQHSVFVAETDRDKVTGILLYCLDDTQDNLVHARMFCPLHGVDEDPATGSAGVVVVGLLAHLAAEKDMNLSITIEQGRDMDRTSTLHAAAIKQNGVVTQTTIGGNCVEVLRGTLTL